MPGIFPDGGCGGGHLSIQLIRRKAQGRMREQTVLRGLRALYSRGGERRVPGRKWREVEQNLEGMDMRVVNLHPNILSVETEVTWEDNIGQKRQTADLGLRH